MRKLNQGRIASGKAKKAKSSSPDRPINFDAALNVRLPVMMLEQLQSVATRSGLTVSDYCRNVIALALIEEMV